MVETRKESSGHQRLSPVVSPAVPMAQSSTTAGLTTSMLRVAISFPGFANAAREILDLLVPALDADAAFLSLRAAGSQQERFLSSWGAASDPPWSKDLERSVESSGLPALVADLESDGRATDGADLVGRGWHAYLCQPVLWAGGVVGVLHVIGRQPGCFDERSLERAAAASQVLALAAAARGQAGVDPSLGAVPREEEAEILIRLSRSLGKLTQRAAISTTLFESLPTLADPELAVITLAGEDRPCELTVREYHPTSERLRAAARDGSLAALSDAGGQKVEEVQAQTILSGSGILGGTAARWRSTLHEPIIRCGKTEGLVSLYSTRGRAFHEPQQRMLTAAAAQVSLSLQRLESQEEAQRVHLESVVDAMGDGLLWVDGGWRIRMANPAARRLLEDLSDSSHPSHLTSLGPVDLKTLAEELKKKPAQRSHVAFTLEPGGRRISLTASAVGKAAADADGLVLLLADVTEQHRLQQKLHQSEKLSSLGEMISGVAHELNNPLAAVMGHAQLLDSDLVDVDRRREKIRTIHREAFRCQRIVQNLLSFVRNQNPEKAPIDLNEAIRAVIRLLEYALRVDDIVTEVRLSDELPAVFGDEHQLQQVILNLVNNAHHALREVARPRHLKLVTETAGEWVRVIVADNGSGIPPENLSKIFDSFFSTKAAGKGTGLGLSLAHGCIQDHGGDIRVESPPGQGTRVTLELPAIAQRAEPRQAEVERPIRPWRPSQARTILVADDEPSLAEVIGEVLIAAGHRVLLANDGVEARRYLERESVDLIVTDLMMPHLSGRELYEVVLKEFPALASRIIFSTGDTLSQSTREFLRRTGCPYLIKPFPIAALQDLVEGIFGEQADDEAG